MRKISVFIITLNEEERINRTLNSVKSIADEIIVVDSGSTDQTCAISEGHSARIYHRKFDGYGFQKRFAEDKCANDWVLNLDADEVLSDELQRRIHELKRFEGDLEDGYRIRVQNVYPGEERPRKHCPSYNEIRLYNKSKNRFRNHAIYDRVVMSDSATTGQLDEPVFHFPFLSFIQLSAKLDKLSLFQAQNSNKGTAEIALRIPFEFPFQFLKFYIFRRHVFGGTAGLIFSLTSAYYRWLRVVRMLKNSNGVSA